MNYTTSNEGCGFHGAIASGTMVQRLINGLYHQVAETLVEHRILTAGQAVEFLDSRQGRHFADQIGHAKSPSDIEDLTLKYGPIFARDWKTANLNRNIL